MDTRALHVACRPLCAALLAWGCAAAPKPLGDEALGSFRATAPRDVTTFWDRAGATDLDHDGITTKHEVLSQLPNEGGHATRVLQDDAGHVLAVGVNESVRGGRYEVTLDHMRYCTDAYAPGGEAPMIVHSGVGTRIQLRFVARRAGVNLTKLFAIAEAADDGALAGTIQLEAIGISGPGIERLIPRDGSISGESVYDVLEAAEAIRAKLNDSGDDIQLVARVFGRRKAFDEPVAPACIVEHSSPALATSGAHELSSSR
jgi:hypothetical protein